MEAETRNALKKLLKDIYGDIAYTRNLLRTEDSFGLARLRWDANLITPYYMAYSNAYNNYMEQLKIRNNTRTQNVEMAMVALSLCSGCAFIAVLGCLNIGRLLEDMALKIVCERNMEKTFNVMVAIKGSPVAQFILGQTTNQVLSWAGGGTKRELKNINSLGSQIPLQTPGQIQSAMKLLYEKAEIAVRMAFRELISRSDLRSTRSKILGDILNSPFCRPPVAPVWPDVQVLSDRIELSFYLKLVLASDYEYFFLPKGASYKKPINELPSSKKYPPERSAGDAMRTMSKTVGFEDIGDNIAKRINALYKKKKVVTEDGHGEDLVYDGWFFDGATYKGVKKVEQVLDHLGDLSAANARTEACRVRSKKVVLI